MFRRQRSTGEWTRTLVPYSPVHQILWVERKISIPSIVPQRGKKNPHSFLFACLPNQHHPIKEHSTVMSHIPFSLINLQSTETPPLLQTKACLRGLHPSEGSSSNQVSGYSGLFLELTFPHHLQWRAGLMFDGQTQRDDICFFFCSQLNSFQLFLPPDSIQQPQFLQQAIAFDTEHICFSLS